MRTAGLPTAAILRAALADPADPPRHWFCAFPPGSPWLDLLVSLTEPALPAQSSRRKLVAADAFENTAAQTPLSGATRPRLRAPFPARQQSWRQKPWPFARDRRRSEAGIRRGGSSPRPFRPAAPARPSPRSATTPCAWPDAPRPAPAADAARRKR